MLVTKHVLAASSTHSTPYMVRGAASGPVMVVTSGVHGNETASMAAAQNSPTIAQQDDYPFSVVFSLLFQE